MQAIATAGATTPFTRAEREGNAPTSGVLLGVAAAVTIDAGTTSINEPGLHGIPVFQ